MKYDDIINLPHPEPKMHPRMPAEKRAAQFAPFAALTGYEDAVEETARLTDARVELDDNALEELNRRLKEACGMQKESTITYFVPDEKKSGGAYVKLRGQVKKTEADRIVMEDGTVILLDRIREIQDD